MAVKSALRRNAANQRFRSTGAGFWPSARNVPIRPSATVTISAPRVAASGRPRQPGEAQIHQLGDDHPGGERAADHAEQRGCRAEQAVLDHVSRDQPPARCAERLEDDGVIDAMAVAGRKRAAKHQRRGEQCHRARGSDAEHQIGDEAADGLRALPSRGTAVTLGKLAETALMTSTSCAAVPPPG